jgi:hypothetical protein
MTLSEDFAIHLRENSFVTPNGSYHPGDLARSVNGLSEVTEKQSKENLDKLKKFVIAGNQKLAISSYKRGGGNRIVPWAVSQPYLDFLDSSLNYEEWAKEGSCEILNSYDWKSFNSAYSGLKRDHIPSFIIKLIKARYKTLYQTDNSDIEFKYVKMELDYIANERKFWTSCIIRASREFANVVALGRGAIGRTFSYGNLIVVRGHVGSNYKRMPDKITQSLRSNAEKIIKLRGYSRPLSYANKKSTFSFGCPFSGNECMAVSTYIHEVGHQFYFRCRNKPPKNSVSLGRKYNRGLSGYSTHSDDEAFAEAFVAFVITPETLAKHDKPLYDWVNDTVSTVLGR